MNQNLGNIFFLALSVFFRSISGNTFSDMEFTGDSLWLGTDFGLVAMDTSYHFNIYLHDPYNNQTIANSEVWEIFEDKSGDVS